MRLKVGQRVKFEEERQAYTVMAANDRFAVCTKPFNLKHTVLYSIVDMRDRIRGTENLIFCLGFGTKEECSEALQRITSGESEISSRNRIPLRISTC